MSYGNNNYGQGGDQGSSGYGQSGQSDYGQSGGYGQQPSYGQQGDYGQSGGYGQPSGPDNYSQPSAPDAHSQSSAPESYAPNQDAYAQNPYGQPQDPYGQPQDPYGQDPYGQGAYGQPGAEQGGYPVAAYGQPYGAAYGYSDAHPPRPRVGFGQAMKLFFKNYVNFYGRASRSEYWWTVLAGVLLSLLLFGVLLAIMIPAAQVDPELNNVPPAFGIFMLLGGLVSLAWLIPSISVQVRRLHDAGFSGFFALFRLASLDIIPLIMCAFESKPEGVKYDNPDGSQPAVD